MVDSQFQTIMSMLDSPDENDFALGCRMFIDLRGACTISAKQTMDIILTVNKAFAAGFISGERHKAMSEVLTHVCTTAQMRMQRAELVEKGNSWWRAMRTLCASDQELFNKTFIHDPSAKRESGRNAVFW